ncbi:MAG: 2-oxoglutarate ferredoxin oxidoreductase subunit alpha, partial [Bacteroidota bacterium]
IANGAEPWRFPKADSLAKISPKFAEARQHLAGEEVEAFLPYARDERLVREWALPGTPGLAHRIGGLEKQDGTGNVSYDPANHEHMVKTREAKVEGIKVPDQVVESGPEKGELLVLGWGSTYGVIRQVVRELSAEGHKIAHAHLRYIKPFPANLEAILHNYDQVLIPEINNGQLIKVIKEQFLIPAVAFNKIQGVPITKSELAQAARDLLSKA